MFYLQKPRFKIIPSTVEESEVLPGTLRIPTVYPLPVLTEHFGHD